MRDSRRPAGDGGRRRRRQTAAKPPWVHTPFPANPYFDGAPLFRDLGLPLLQDSLSHRPVGQGQRRPRRAHARASPFRGCKRAADEWRSLGERAPPLRNSRRGVTEIADRRDVERARSCITRVCMCMSCLYGCVQGWSEFSSLRRPWRGGGGGARRQLSDVDLQVRAHRARRDDGGGRAHWHAPSARD